MRDAGRVAGGACYLACSPMRLRLPDTGSLFDTLLRSLGDPIATSSGDWATDAPSAEQLDDSLAALARGDIEYVILEDDEDFLQVAGEGDGPYQVQVSEQAKMREIAGGTSAAAMREIVQAYRRGDPGWRDAAWTPMT